jgi:hypothetical protein
MRYLFILILTVAFVNIKAQDKLPPEINFCHVKVNYIYLDSLKKCGEMFANDKEIKITSYRVSFNINSNDKDARKFTVLGSVFTDELKKALEENKRNVNDIEIYDVHGEKVGRTVPLTGGTFKFVW